MCIPFLVLALLLFYVRVLLRSDSSSNSFRVRKPVESFQILQLDNSRKPMNHLLFETEDE